MDVTEGVTSRWRDDPRGVRRVIGARRKDSIVTAGHITRSAVRSADGTTIAFECSSGGSTLGPDRTRRTLREYSAFGQLGEQLVA